ncbi:MAG: NAD(P)/FAD-dependent oxidoreductase [Endomicrobium sp.]|jgi:dihydrolipoamide dehydrogenase|nr:NAD(P)/FAD-dependent oxidoreductase [Endomicrobium sp.]
MNSDKYDIAVIGSGPGGFTAAVRSSQFGARVVLIEKSFMGGTCLNCGCIPTKFLWQALKMKQKIQKSYEYGFKTFLEPIVFADIVAKKDKNISSIRKGMDLVLKSHDVTVVSGAASFKDKNTLRVLNDGNSTNIFADKIIIAVGTDPLIIKNLEFDRVKIIDSTDVLNLQKIPKNMLIIGGGVIGIEMATIFAGFGCHITLAERENKLLPNEDNEISEEIKKNLLRQDVEVLTECTNALDNLDNMDKYEKVLIATGRTPKGDLNLEKANIKITKNGFIETDEFCQTSTSNIYAVGDIAGKTLLAYTAQNEGAIAAENGVKGNSIKIDNSVVPQVVFAMPQSSSVKVSNFLNYKDIIFGKFSLTASSRAFIENERLGFVKCAVDKVTKRPLAFWIIGAHCDELVNTASQILKNGIKLSRETMFHPSFGESLFNAYEDAFGMCTEITRKKVK